MKRYASQALVGAFLALVVWTMAIAPQANAQTVYGTLLGTVQDQQGAVVPHAEVSARNLETRAVRTVVTDSNGAYRISSVPAGPYQVLASASGFKTELRSGVSVTVGADIKVDFVLSVGAVTEQVTVSGELPQVDAITSTMGGLVNAVTIRELPLNGRDWLQLAQLQPGATFFRGQRTDDVARLPRGLGQAISISGGRPSENAYRIDGLIVNDFANQSPGSSMQVNLGVDAIREFTVLTNTYSAEYGRASGGVVNAITKSGTNDLHGSAFYFPRNSALDARNFFDKFDQPIPPFRRHQFGGSLGGPIRREKTFYFANYEGLREFKSLSFTSDTLSPNARRGILCSNPACTATSAVTIDARVKPYLALYPPPNGRISGDTGKFVFGGGRNGTEDFVIGKMDHLFSQKTTLSGTYRYDGAQATTPDAFNQKLTAAQSRNQNFILSLQHVFTPTVINNLRAGVTRAWASDGFDLAPQTPLLTDVSLGFLPGIPAGEFAVSGLDTFGGIGDTGADIVGYTAPQVYDDLSWTRGRQSLRFGFGLERIYDNVNPQTTPNGLWRFGSIRELLMANPSQFTAGVPGSDTVRGLRSTIIAGYLQDDFRLRPNMTLNLGVRYETSTSINEVKGKIANLHNFTDAQPALGNPLFLNPTLLNFEPRVGLAWDPFKDGKTAIRAGFGIYDVLPLPHLFWNRATHGLPFFQLGVVSKPPGVVENPLARSFPDKGLALIKADPSTLRVASIEFQPHRAYKMQWNFNVQRQFPGNLSLMVGYVGSSSVHLPIGQNDADMVPPALVTRTSDGHLQFPTNPAPSLPGAITRINPKFGRIDTTLWNGHSSYHSLQTNLAKRMSHGLTFQGTYTWSKNIDNASTFFSQNETLNSADSGYIFDPRINRGVSSFDVPHSAAIHLVWEVPSAASLTGVPKFLLAGWQLGGIFTAQSGSPFSVGLAADWARTGTSTRQATSGERPDFNPAPGCTPNVVTGDPSNYINTKCFAAPALGTLGNLGRNTLRSPAVQAFDFSIFKNHRLWGEKLKVQFRAETFNILNHPNLQAATTTLFDSGNANVKPRVPPKLIRNAGQLKSPTVTTSRQIQFGMKFIW